MSIRGVVIAEGDVDGVVEFQTQAEFDAFSAGLEKGACMYGCGFCGIYTLADAEELEHGEPYEQEIAKMVRNALNRSAKHAP